MANSADAGPEWSWPLYIQVFGIQIGIYAALMSLAAFVGSFFTVTLDGTEQSAAIVGLVFVSILVLFTELILTAVLYECGENRVKHKHCNACGHCYDCHRYKSDDNFWFWMWFWSNNSHSGHSQSVSSSSSSSSSSSKKSSKGEGAFLLIVVIVVCAIAIVGLAFVSSAAITSEILYKRQKYQFDKDNVERKPEFLAGDAESKVCVY